MRLLQQWSNISYAVQKTSARDSEHIAQTHTEGLLSLLILVVHEHQHVDGGGRGGGHRQEHEADVLRSTGSHVERLLAEPQQVRPVSAQQKALTRRIRVRERYALQRV